MYDEKVLKALGYEEPLLNAIKKGVDSSSLKINFPKIKSPFEGVSYMDTTSITVKNSVIK